jgi:hypothetical protein
MVSAVGLAFGGMLFWPGPSGRAQAQAQPPQPPPKVVHGPEVTYYPFYQDVSRPLRELIRPVPDHPGREVKDLRPLPFVDGPQPPGGDPVAQLSTAPAAPSAITGFAGVGQGDYGFSVRYAPPDTNLAVGPNHVVQWVNVSFAIFSKTGALLQGPAAGDSIWTGFGGGCDTNNDGDPIIQYDKAANRWLFTQFSVSTTPYLQCVAVSTTGDPLGAYYRYAFSYGNTQFPDYPKLGVWPDGYYITYNIFNNGTTFGGAKLCAFDRATMLSGGLATQQCFQLSTSYGGVLPADVDGSTAPPAGAPGLFLSKGSNSLNLWSMKVNWTTPSLTTLTGPTNIPVAAFSSPSGAAVPQPGTSQKLDTLGDRLMYRLAYRNRAGSESLVVNHAATVGTGKRSSTIGTRWYELRRTGGVSGAWGVVQQSTFSPNTTYRWMGSVAMDKQGNMGLAYSASSGSVYPSMAYTARFVTDPLGTMQAESILKAGAGSQQRNLSRWGDYSSLQVDPTDDCTFWFTSEYLKANGTFNWSTWIGSFKLPGCN